jgi:hypothetical protein
MRNTTFLVAALLLAAAILIPKEQIIEGVKWLSGGELTITTLENHQIQKDSFEMDIKIITGKVPYQDTYILCDSITGILTRFCSDPCLVYDVYRTVEYGYRLDPNQEDFKVSISSMVDSAQTRYVESSCPKNFPTPDKIPKAVMDLITDYKDSIVVESRFLNLSREIIEKQIVFQIKETENYLH